MLRVLYTDESREGSLFGTKLRFKELFCTNEYSSQKKEIRKFYYKIMFSCSIFPFRLLMNVNNL